ncbi:MAG TPA: PQQ-dependent sugar dehydrogenase [Burkholderiales bacterium]|nr:PQQ-dependent sugar dehydrogenase [Burkholderiales bacterium]
MSAMRSAAVAAAAAIFTLSGCYNVRPSSGGGEKASATLPRKVDPADVAVPAGYRIEAVATGFTFPTGVAFDASGIPHVVEAGYSYGEVFTTPRLVRVNKDGTTTEVARGSNNGPWTGVAYANGAFYVAEGGQMQGGRILRITPDGKIAPILENLPGQGDHHTNGPAIGPDGAIYFGQGTATNSAVVGEDNLKFGWLKRFPKFHDIPCRDVTLAGVNYETKDVPLAPDLPRTPTGAFVPFGTTTQPGQVIKGQIPCSGAIMKVAPGGGAPELVAWGFRNPFGLAFAPDGQLYATDNGYDDRGSRPVWGTPDVLWRVTPGAWYGWPDYSEGKPINQEFYKVPMKGIPQLVLAKPPGKPPQPVASLGVHSSSNGIDFSRSASFGHVGQAFIAEFGDQAPETGKSLHPVGFRVIRVDVKSGRIEDFVVNRSDKSGPASKIGSAGIERPVGLRFDPSGNALYIVDFGIMLMDKMGPKPQQRTGVLWRVARGGAS